MPPSFSNVSSPILEYGSLLFYVCLHYRHIATNSTIENQKIQECMLFEIHNLNSESPLGIPIDINSYQLIETCSRMVSSHLGDKN